MQPTFQSEDAAYIDYEPDARHVQILKQQLGITDTSKSLGQPGSKREVNADATPLRAMVTTLS